MVFVVVVIVANNKKLAVIRNAVLGSPFQKIQTACPAGCPMHNDLPSINQPGCFRGSIGAWPTRPMTRD